MILLYVAKRLTSPHAFRMMSASIQRGPAGGIDKCEATHNNLRRCVMHNNDPHPFDNDFCFRAYQ